MNVDVGDAVSLQLRSIFPGQTGSSDSLQQSILHSHDFAYAGEEGLKGSASEVERAGFIYQNHIRDKKALVCIISYANVLFMFHWTSRGRERAFRWKEKKSGGGHGELYMWSVVGLI